MSTHVKYTAKEIEGHIFKAYAPKTYAAYKALPDRVINEDMKPVEFYGLGNYLAARITLDEEGDEAYNKLCDMLSDENSTISHTFNEILTIDRMMI